MKNCVTKGLSYGYCRGGARESMPISASPIFFLLRSISMTKLPFLAFSLTHWFSGAWLELCQYFNNMSTTQWGVIASASVAFGFLCLRGNALRR